MKTITRLFVISVFLTALSHAQNSEGTITGWTTKVGRYNPGSGREQDLKYIFQLRTASRVYDFDTDNKEFNVGDQISYALKEESEIVIVRKNGKSRKYTLVGIRELSNCDASPK